MSIIKDIELKEVLDYGTKEFFRTRKRNTKYPSYQKTFEDNLKVKTL